MFRLLKPLIPAGLSYVLALTPASAEGVGRAVHSVPVTEEPLHVVRHRSDDFIVYTNWIGPGIWTLYHQHRHDLLAVIPAATTAASQQAGGDTREQTAPAGTVVFFPYADDEQPFVHRVGATGSAPFINVGLEFQGATAANCAVPAWDVAGSEALAPNRRGQGYRLRLDSGLEVALPTFGRGLLIVPLDSATLAVDGAPWTAAPGDFRFYDGTLAQRLRNLDSAAANLVIFSAC